MIGADSSGVLHAVEEAHEGFEPALVIEIVLLDFRVARVGQHDMHAGIEKGQFAQTMLDRRVIELDHGEGGGGRQEGDFRAALGLAVFDRRRAGDDERAHRVAIGELHEMLFAVAPDAQLQPDRQRVDDGDADAVQAAGNLVRILVELSAGVQLRHDDLRRRNALLVVDAGGDAASVVGDGAGAVGVQSRGDQRRVAGERLVDGVVDDLIDHVVQAGAVVGVADIHARALAHRVETAQNLDGAGAIFFYIIVIIVYICHFGVPDRAAPALDSIWLILRHDAGRC